MDRRRHAYLAVDEAGDAVEAERLARAVAQEFPDDGATWFNLGLYAKRRHDWAESLRCNARALALADDPREEPAAWNLGIAATALGRWDDARTAWRAWGGLDVPDGDGPLRMRLGTAPVRLNPDDTGAGPTAEVVWTERLSPCHGRVVSVPTPGSRHRHGDVVLMDGVPNGERFDGSRWVSVFDEILVLTRSSAPTWTVEVTAPAEADSDALQRSADDAGLAAEDWTSGLRTLCVACSTGRPGAHDHEPADSGWSPRRSVALAGASDAVAALLAAWADAAPGRAWDALHEVG
ncbi:tetratricopeptide repeat protein [Cellulomonas fimi]|uniref:Tetratricopeptide TPR_1 repeat-containing protein n=1 Tax=Cellulomonas fimi (strain ATCC 484 / DSM 20113 / JCM 1341 / CCUG 24087 / LMG 16345 / NBRC 15513 / NCIMB 8980 / NCTC 7547 / NRS-133) TaxID=590998 RepID=F4H2D8_CELFA|nr:tetratricopeptide repeat protein [Cellulomonas fimi]AEE47558.1 hypothetical protein Celf_3446 [Cellulomonas fimi ATCC 484]VEH36532.1 Predicted O-linked N-acetylglucosamine transferase, SPINDLY family [Cellulomonas fimi]